MPKRRSLFQGVYPLCRIVHFTQRCFQVFWFYLLATPVQFLLSCVLICPLLVWHSILYLPSERYCFLSASNLAGDVWTAAFMYFIPIGCLSFMYARILVYIRRQSHTQTSALRRRQIRDLLVLRRVLILVGILLGLTVPSTILEIIEYITGHENPLQYRGIWLSFQSSALALSVLTIFVTPQLKSIVINTWQPN
jgi:hypothetical protein